MKHIYLAFFGLFTLLATAQDEVKLVEINGINSADNEIVTGVWGDALLVSVSYRYSLISDWSADDQPMGWRAVYAPRRATWESVFERDWPLPIDENAMAASYAAQDSAIYYVKPTGEGVFGIFRMKLKNGVWGQEEDLQLHSATYSAVQPAISPKGDELLYVRQPIGEGSGMIMYAVSKNGNFGQGVPLNDSINRPGPKLLPQWDGRDILFSAERPEGIGGLDVYRATKKSQWEHVEHLPEPFNSAYNDLSPVTIGRGKGVISTDRNDPTRGYDIMLYYTVQPPASVDGLTALLECKGVPVQHTQVEVMNASGETVYEANTGATGTFDLSKLQLKQSYKVLFTGSDEEVLRHSFLYILDKFGNRIMVFAPGADGMFIFELLPVDEIDGMQLLDEKDNWTLLAVDIEGQVYEEQPGDVEEGVPIYITDEHGELMAIAYTTEKGKFHFDQLSPQAQYSFRVDEESNATSMVIFDQGEETVIPLVNGKGEFERIPKNEVVNIVNEKGESIAIRKEETFIIEHIYYELNSAELNLVAKYQLDQLADIMKKNQDIHIELNSHTDSRGDSDYNLELSQRRANTAVNYLLKKGVEPHRMVAKGYGETKLLNGCKDGVVCAEEQHALNRRTEIKIYIR